MTRDELNDLIQKECRGYFGILDHYHMRRLISALGKDLTDIERYSLYGQLVYDARYDRSLKLNFDE